MHKQYSVVSAVGRDRPGFVNAIAGIIHRSGGNIELQRSVRMANEYAVVILFSVPGGLQSADHAMEQLEGLNCQDMMVHVRPAVSRSESPAGESVQLSATGADQPGILEDVTRLLFSREINIESMNYDTHPAPMTGELLFSMKAELSVPEEVDLKALVDELHELEAEYNFDITLTRELS